MSNDNFFFAPANEVRDNLKRKASPDAVVKSIEERYATYLAQANEALKRGDTIHFVINAPDPEVLDYVPASNVVAYSLIQMISDLGIEYAFRFAAVLMNLRELGYNVYHEPVVYNTKRYEIVVVKL